MNDLASCPTIRSQAGAAAADVVHHHIFQPLIDEIEGLHLELRRKLMTGSASPSADYAVTRTNSFGDVDNTLKSRGLLKVYLLSEPPLSRPHTFT